MTVAVRPERAGEEAAVCALTTAAFAGKPYSDGSEAAIVERLRADGDLALSLVAESASGEIVGHAAFSPVTIEDAKGGWFGLGPVSVVPIRQRAGIGSMLIRAGLERLRDQTAQGVVVLGNPAYYRRFGFAHDPALRYPGPPPEYFQALSFGGHTPQGEVRYAPAFG